MPDSNALSDAEFHQQALAGGASRRLSDGKVPDRGFMVGGARDLENQPFNEISHPVDSFTVDHVRHHARAIRDQFGSQATNIHQGAWVEDDKVVLDASEQMRTYTEAISAAKSRGERAIYDVAHNQERHTKDARAVN